MKVDIGGEQFVLVSEKKNLLYHIFNNSCCSELQKIMFL